MRASADVGPVFRTPDPLAARGFRKICHTMYRSWAWSMKNVDEGLYSEVLNLKIKIQTNVIFWLVSRIPNLQGKDNGVVAPSVLIYVLCGVRSLGPWRGKRRCGNLVENITTHFANSHTVNLRLAPFKKFRSG